MIASLPHLTKKEDNIKAFNQYQKITHRRSQTSFRQGPADKLIQKMLL
jgi:hypothetical protein